MRLGLLAVRPPDLRLGGIRLPDAAATRGVPMGTLVGRAPGRSRVGNVEHEDPAWGRTEDRARPGR